jgi:hypothetical protein
MRSRSSGATLSYDPTTYELQFCYFFETSPTAELSAANPPQKLGSAVARISLDQPDNLSITYTNERGAGGDVILERAAKVGARKRKRHPASATQVQA